MSEYDLPEIFRRHVSAEAGVVAVKNDLRHSPPFIRELDSITSFPKLFLLRANLKCCSLAFLILLLVQVVKQTTQFRARFARRCSGFNSSRDQ